MTDVPHQIVRQPSEGVLTKMDLTPSRDQEETLISPCGKPQNRSGESSASSFCARRTAADIPLTYRLPPLVSPVQADRIDLTLEDSNA